MKNLAVLIFASFISVSAFAGTYTCTTTNNDTEDFGDTFKVVVQNPNIHLEATTQGDVNGTLDRTYKPHAQNAGSVRYNGAVDNGNGSGCDAAQLMLNKAMATGKAGTLTISYDCDSDGTGPVFIVYDCK